MANEVYELTVGGLLGTQYVESTMHMLGTGTNPNDTLDGGNSLLTGWVSSIQSAWLALLSQDYYLKVIAARRAFPKPSFVAKAQYPGLTGGGSVGSTFSSFQLNPVLFLVPAMGFKSGGKIFMPGVSEGDIASNAYSAGYVTRIQTFSAAMLAGFTQGGIAWSWVVYSRKLQAFSAVKQTHLSPVVGFQRRRAHPIMAG